MTQDFLWDRLPSWGPDATRVAALWESLRDRHAPLTDDGSPESIRAAALCPGPWSADDIRPLLGHRDPKVRTLGIMLMFQLNRVDVLPDLAPLAYDVAATFRLPVMLDNEPHGPWPMTPQSVGSFAQSAIRTYAAKSDELQGLFAKLSPHYVTGDDSLDGNAEDLRARLAAFATKRDPVLCTPSLMVAMDRATNGTEPVQRDREGRVRAVVDLLDEVPMPRRFFVAVALGVPEYAGRWDMQLQLQTMARGVPRDARLKVLRGVRPTVDPDLSAGIGFGYLVEHAGDLFRAADADLFLKMADDALSPPAGSAAEAGEYGRCVLAAARLRPADADAIFGAAANLMDRPGSSDGRSRETLALGMAELGGEQSEQRLIRWLFEMNPASDEYRLGRQGVLSAIAAAQPARARRLYERLIRDPRLARLGPTSTLLLIQAVQGYLGRPLASDDEIGESYSHDEAQRDGPFKPLVAWHEALRATVDEWSR